MCGNLGLLLCDAGQQELTASELLRLLFATTEVRGALGGGFAVTTWEGGGSIPPTSSYRVRTIPKKRQSLSDKLARRYVPHTRVCPTRFTTSSRGRTTSVLGHTRYPTSSRTLQSELHPHCWGREPARSPGLWFADAECDEDNQTSLGTLPVKPAANPQLQGIFVSHNGDFSEYELFGERVSNATLGRWLGLVLHHPNGCTGDSPKIAGLLELLATKGSWDHSARLAYQRAVATAPADACGGDPRLPKGAASTAPTTSWCVAAGKCFGALWRKVLAEECAATKASVKEGRGGISCGPNSSAVLDNLEAGDGRQGRVSVRLEAAMKAAALAPGSLAAIDADVVLWPEGARVRFVEATVGNFLRAGIFSAMCAFMKKAHGSFGLQATSAAEPRTVAIAAKGQPMSLAVSPADRIALWGSEGTAVEVPIPGKGGVRSILRLDNTKGQIVELKATNHKKQGKCAGKPRARGVHAIEWENLLQVRSFDCSQGCFHSGDELLRLLRSFQQLAPPTPLGLAGSSKSRRRKRDLVLEDIRSIPSVLSRISADWQGTGEVADAIRGKPCNRRSARCFVEALSRSLDLLVVGIEVSLFVSEQFAADVSEHVPCVCARAVSANLLLRDSQGSLSLKSLRETGTVVLIVSQSGQTFPSLAATARLCHHLGSRVFVLVGGAEDSGGAVHSEMGGVVMQHHREALGRDGSDRVFCNLSGVRLSEPSSVAVAATHHTLTELLLFTHLHLPARQPDRSPGAAPGADSAREGKAQGAVGAASRANGACNKEQAKAARLLQGAAAAFTPPFLATLSSIVGCDARGDLTPGGRRVETALRKKSALCRFFPAWVPHTKGEQQAGKECVHEELVAVGRRWGKHISECWRVLFLSGLYILVTVVFGIPLLRLVLLTVAHLDPAHPGCWNGVSVYVYDVAEAREVEACGALPMTVGTLVAVGDALLYICMPVLLTRGLRWVEGRPLRHRFGKRTLVVADPEVWVGKCTEAFLSKLYSLARGFAVPEVHSADPSDDLTHRFTHRAVRGLLLAVGRPDGRLCALTSTEAAVLLATKQMAFVENMGSHPEIVTLGCNPYADTGSTLAHVVLPSSGRPLFADEHLYAQQCQAEDAPPGGVPLVSAPVEVSVACEGAAADGVKEEDKRKEEEEEEEEEGVPVLWPLDGNGRGVIGFDAVLNPAGRSSKSSNSATDKEALLPRRAAPGAAPALCAPSELSVFQANLDASLGSRGALWRLEREVAPAQRLLEARFASLERFAALAVLCHASAEATQEGLWGDRRGWDTSRSQSHMRVSTTACPVALQDTKGDLEEEEEQGGNHPGGGRSGELAAAPEGR